MIVIKYGGHALPENGRVDKSLEVVAIEFKKGKQFVLVHGGGPQINKELELHNIKPEMINGRRKTTPEVLSVVSKVLSGEVLRGIVNQLISLGVNAVGISSGDGGTIRAIYSEDALGEVGVVDKVDPTFLNNLLKNGYLPVISPIGVNEKGAALNLNADSVAGSLAGALKCERALFMTDVSGIYKEWPKEDSLIHEIKLDELLILKEKVTEGMIPKVEALITAVSSGAKSAYVFDGRNSANLEKAINGDCGTKVIP